MPAPLDRCREADERRQLALSRAEHLPDQRQSLHVHAGEAFDADTWARNCAHLAKYYADSEHEFALAQYLLAAADAAAQQAPEAAQVCWDVVWHSPCKDAGNWGSRPQAASALTCHCLAPLASPHTALQLSQAHAPQCQRPHSVHCQVRTLPKSLAQPVQTTLSVQAELQGELALARGSLSCRQLAL